MSSHGYCRVIGRSVPVMPIRGERQPVACPEFDAPTGVCRLKQQMLDSGFLPVFLSAVTEPLVGPAGVSCGLARKVI
jgi:hypothetical protein